MKKLELFLFLSVISLYGIECKQDKNASCVLLADSCSRDKNCCNAGFCCEKSTNSSMDHRYCNMEDLCCHEGYNCVEVDVDEYSNKILSVVAAICFLITIVTTLRCCYLAKTKEITLNDVEKRY